jgi:diadenosine tetraphosphate (Ap4A) HIT family hydrolase/8-oxo-dGTP pyrophosphatase MutT (NUDIX family)
VNSISPDEQAKQVHYRDARFTDSYDNIWQTVGKCVYCDLNPKYVFFEENGVVMTINLYAYIDGHMLIVPRRHVRSPKDLTDDEWTTIRKCFYLAKRLLKEVHGAGGVQLIQKDGAAAQSTVTDHVHFQAIPFDAPDLCVWNYRQLKNTPLENAQLYRAARKKIIKYDQRYDAKYQNFTRLNVQCTAFLVNERREVLFQERAPQVQLPSGILTPPGGRIENIDATLELGLVREIREETGLTLDPNKFTLIDSRLETLQRYRHSKPLKAVYEYADRFIWNTYFQTGLGSKAQLAPGDDAGELLWIPLAKAVKYDRISPEVRQNLVKLQGLL